MVSQKDSKGGASRRPHYPDARMMMGRIVRVSNDPFIVADFLNGRRDDFVVLDIYRSDNHGHCIAVEVVVATIQVTIVLVDNGISQTSMEIHPQMIANSSNLLVYVFSQGFAAQSRSFVTWSNVRLWFDCSMSCCY